MFPERALLEEELEAHHMRCVWSAQILTDVAVQSYMHDTCALLQMPPEGVPGLADVVQQQLSAFAVIDQYLEVRRRPFRDTGAVAANAPRARCAGGMHVSRRDVCGVVLLEPVCRCVALDRQRLGCVSLRVTRVVVNASSA